MRSFALTDWITIRGNGTSTVVQSEEDWLDLVEYADATFWIAVGASPDVKAILLTATIPLARYFRWRLTPVGGTGTTGASDVTFRIAVAANMVGGMR